MLSVNNGGIFEENSNVRRSPFAVKERLKGKSGLISTIKLEGSIVQFVEFTCNINGRVLNIQCKPSFGVGVTKKKAFLFT